MQSAMPTHPAHQSSRPSIRNLRRQLPHNISETEPTSRLYDIAEHFEVSEAELLATRCGDTVTRLDAHCWSELIRELPKLGCVTAMTRNRHAVHKKIGTYRNAPHREERKRRVLQVSLEAGCWKRPRIMGGRTLELDNEIVPQLFLHHWQSGFAVVEEINVGHHPTLRRSLQFFDPAGTVVHKIFLMEDSNHDAYETLVKHFTNADQSPEQRVSLVPKPLRQTRDSDIDIKGLRAYWQALREPRDFNYMLERFDVIPIQALRLAGNDLAYRVAPTGFRQLMQVIVARELPIAVSVGSAGVTQTHTGLIHDLHTVGSWLTVREPRFVLYLREDHIHTAWVVKKPSADGMVTALELYDGAGQPIAVLTGPGQAWAEVWRDALFSFVPSVHSLE
jgi:putative hemin transport protein